MIKESGSKEGVPLFTPTMFTPQRLADEGQPQFDCFHTDPLDADAPQRTPRPAAVNKPPKGEPQGIFF